MLTYSSVGCAPSSEIGWRRRLNDELVFSKHLTVPVRRITTVYPTVCWGVVVPVIGFPGDLVVAIGSLRILEILEYVALTGKPYSVESGRGGGGGKCVMLGQFCFLPSDCCFATRGSGCWVL